VRQRCGCEACEEGQEPARYRAAILACVAARLARHGAPLGRASRRCASASAAGRPLLAEELVRDVVGAALAEALVEHGVDGDAQHRGRQAALVRECRHEQGAAGAGVDVLEVLGRKPPGKEQAAEGKVPANARVSGKLREKY